MYRSQSLLDASSSDRPESDLEPVASMTTGSASAVPSLPNSPRHSTEESPPTSTAWTSAGQSSARTTCPPRRFYHHSSSHSENPLRHPAGLYDRIWSRERAALDRSRDTALQTIACCQQVVTTLELARMTATRWGTGIWIEFWSTIYPRGLTIRLSEFISQAQRRVDTTFRDTAYRLHSMLTQKQDNLRWAATEAQIIWELQTMEEAALWLCERRRRTACRIMEKLCNNIQRAMNVHITPDVRTDMQRGIFGLDSVCDYYPHRLDSGHTAISLDAPQLVYDPFLAAHYETTVQLNDTLFSVPPGYRPYGNYQLQYHHLA